MNTADDRFADAETEAHASKLGMWIFLASEVLLFAALFALYAGSRAHRPEAFAHAIEESARVLGSINTAVLLTSSALVAGAVHASRASRRTLSAILVTGTIVLGAAFLVIKAFEYREHLRAGIAPGQTEFWTLYFGMTGLHAVHVFAGMSLLAFMLLTRASAHRLELAAIYWHLVDVVWIFLWPLFYLA